MYASENIKLVCVIYTKKVCNQNSVTVLVLVVAIEQMNNENINDFTLGYRMGREYVS